MKRIPLLLLCALPLVLPRLAAADHRLPRSNAVDRAWAELAAMREIVDAHCGYSRDRFCRRMRRHLRRMDRVLRRLDRRRGDPYGAAAPHGPAAYPALDSYGTPVLSAVQASQLEVELRSTTSDDGRLDVLSLRAPYYLMTAEQVRRFLDLFWFSRSKLRALRILAPRLVDPENASLLYAAFWTSNDRRQAREILLESRG